MNDNGRIATALAALAVPIDTLQVDPANVRLHSERNIDTIKASLTAFRQQKPIVVDADGLIIAGNGTWEAAKALGWTEIAAMRSDLVGVEKRAYAIADNRTSELAEWDDTALAQTLEALRTDDAIDEALTGFNENEIERLIAAHLTGQQEELPAPELCHETITKRGDLWLLGQHRILCGDSTTPEAMDRLMDGANADMVFTDPPYGVAYDGGTTPRSRLAGDETDALYAPACETANTASSKKAALYLFHAGVKGHKAAAAAAAAAAGYEIRAELIWNKNLAQYGALSAQYKQKHEPFYYCYKRGQTPAWYGPTTEVTVWDYDRAPSNDYHPTQKPIALAERAIRNSSRKGDIVLDIFLGAGSTLIAAEKIGRRCFGIEIEPRYVDVTLKRWVAMTGESPVRESDGAKFLDLLPVEKPTQV